MCINVLKNWNDFEKCWKKCMELKNNEIHEKTIEKMITFFE